MSTSSFAEYILWYIVFHVYTIYFYCFSIMPFYDRKLSEDRASQLAAYSTVQPQSNQNAYAEPRKIHTMAFEPHIMS